MLGIVYLHILYITYDMSVSNSQCPVLYLSIMQRTPLHIAVKEFRVKTAEFLVDNQADINSQDNDGVSIWDYLPMVYIFTV